MRRTSLLALALFALACGAAGSGSSLSGNTDKPRPRHTGKPIDPPASERPPDPVENIEPVQGQEGASCRETKECPDSLRCFDADFSPGMGTPPPRPECSSDKQCDDGKVCAPSGGCIPACTPESCPKGLECQEDGHCDIRSCRAETNPTICARNHRCLPEGVCARMTCKEDSDCDVGYCAGGRCMAKLGRCLPQSYCCPP